MMVLLSAGEIKMEPVNEESPLTLIILQSTVLFRSTVKFPFPTFFNKISTKKEVYKFSLRR